MLSVALDTCLLVELNSWGRDEDGDLTRIDYDDALPVRLTREFLNAPQRFLQHLLDDG